MHNVCQIANSAKNVVRGERVFALSCLGLQNAIVDGQYDVI